MHAHGGRHGCAVLAAAGCLSTNLPSHSNLSCGARAGGGWSAASDADTDADPDADTWQQPPPPLPCSSCCPLPSIRLSMTPSRALRDDTPTDICCISARSSAASTPPLTTPSTPLSAVAVAIAASPGGGGSNKSPSAGSACCVSRRSPTGPRPMAGPRPPGVLLIRARDCSTAASSTAFHLWVVMGDCTLTVATPPWQPQPPEPVGSIEQCHAAKGCP